LWDSIPFFFFMQDATDVGTRENVTLAQELETHVGNRLDELAQKGGKMNVANENESEVSDKTLGAMESKPWTWRFQAEPRDWNGVSLQSWSSKYELEMFEALLNAACNAPDLYECLLDCQTLFGFRD
jgi:hypothetical protein